MPMRGRAPLAPHPRLRAAGRLNLNAAVETATKRHKKHKRSAVEAALEKKSVHPLGESNGSLRQAHFAHVFAPFVPLCGYHNCGI